MVKVVTSYSFAANLHHFRCFFLSCPPVGLSAGKQADRSDHLPPRGLLCSSRRRCWSFFNFNGRHETRCLCCQTDPLLFLHHRPNRADFVLHGQRGVWWWFYDGPISGRSWRGPLHLLPGCQHVRMSECKFACIGTGFSIPQFWRCLSWTNRKWACPSHRLIWAKTRTRILLSAQPMWCQERMRPNKWVLPFVNYSSNFRNRVDFWWSRPPRTKRQHPAVAKKFDWSPRRRSKEQVRFFFG